MAELDFQIKPDGKVFVVGEISFDTVGSALKTDFLSHQSSVHIDFSGVNYADSSGLALMVQWLRQAKEQNIEVTFHELPAKLFSLAEMSNLDQVLPLA